MVQLHDFKPLAPAPSGDAPRPTQANIPPIKKRSTACEACKKRKSKCEGSYPCEKCIRTKSECVFAEELDRRRKLALRQIEHDLRSTCQLLERMVAAYDCQDGVELDRLFCTAKDHVASISTGTKSVKQFPASGFRMDDDDDDDDYLGQG